MRRCHRCACHPPARPTRRGASRKNCTPGARPWRLLDWYNDLTRKKTAATELPEVSVSDDGEVRHLHLGTPWIQGSMRIAQPFEIELEYVQRMMAWLLFADPAQVSKGHAMQLGLGAGAITKF